MSKYNIYLDEVEEMHSRGMRNFEISKELGIDSRRVSDLLKKLGLTSNARVFSEAVSDIQNETFISMAIGDGSLNKNALNKNYRMSLAHSEKQEEYFMKKYNIVKDFVGVPYTFNEQFDKRTERNYYSYKFQSKVNPYFTRLHKRFYCEGKKVIPKDLIEDITPRILAYKFFDDGNMIRVGYQINMSGYSPECLRTFQEIMRLRFGVTTSIHARGDLYVPSKEAEKFKQIVLPYATSDVLYKLGEFRGTPNK